MNQFFGWITDKNELVTVDQYKHLMTIHKDPRFSVVNELARDREELKEIKRSCQAVKNSYDAEWHVYEIACDDYTHNVWKLLLKSGFIRVGSKGDELHFEGVPGYLKDKNEYCVKLADGLEMKPVFDPQRF